MPYEFSLKVDPTKKLSRHLRSLKQQKDAHSETNKKMVETVGAVVKIAKEISLAQTAQQKAFETLSKNVQQIAITNQQLIKAVKLLAEEVTRGVGLMKYSAAMSAHPNKPVQLEYGSKNG